MDKSHGQLPLAIRSRSKAIPIKEPSSEEEPIHHDPVSDKGTSHLSTDPPPVNDFPTASKDAPQLRTRPSHSTATLPKQPPVYNQVDDDTIAGDFEHAFDVYARPFVPNYLTAINTLVGYTIPTPPRVYLDFAGYSSRHIGQGFLPHIPEPIPLPQSTTPEVTSERYEEFFRYHLEAEILCQEVENYTYVIYEAPPASVSQQAVLQGMQWLIGFKVPGLRENSPYVEEDDVVEIRQLRQVPSRDVAGRQSQSVTIEWTGIAYEARVLNVKRKNEEVLLSVTHMGMLVGPYSRFNIQFPVQKQRYAPMQHVLPIIQQGLVLPKDTSTVRSPDVPRHWLQSMLFPTEADGMMQTRLNPGAFRRELFDCQLNREQQMAVERICIGNYGTLPYLVSGPPGTGKTKTLVETALQLTFYDENVSHMLICAPSEPATDTIVQRLSKHLKPHEMLRLNRPSRTFAEVPDAVLPYCYISNGPVQSFSLPPFEELLSYKIVVTSCRDASLLLYSRMANSDLFAAEYGLRKALHPLGKPPKVDLHWGALLVDESAQAMEPEILLPLSIVAPPRHFLPSPFVPLFVMVGDEYQLGPRTSLPSSPLKTSLLGRLFKRSVYAQHPLARSETGKAPPPLSKAMLPILRPAFTNLIRNYRSHPAILAVPSSLFYSDTLVPEAMDTDHLASWSQWQGRKWPVLFVNNNSQDDLEQDGGGWFNRGEAQIAAWYASHLIQSGLVEAKEICIMSPFKAQVARLRKTVRQAPGTWEIDIGPTEAFQGLEKGVVILCTTRTRQRFVEKDQKVGWGLIGMPNKMNVALTRAKFGLIVIGKTDVLLHDPNWEAFINFCERNGLITGNEIGGARLGGHGEPTRLEKVLLAKEYNEEGSRILGGVSQDDEMWIAEQHTALDTSD